jgi:hypothetical protein
VYTSATIRAISGLVTATLLVEEAEQIRLFSVLGFAGHIVLTVSSDRRKGALLRREVMSG